MPFAVLHYLIAGYVYKEENNVQNVQLAFICKTLAVHPVDCTALLVKAHNIVIIVNMDFIGMVLYVKIAE